MSNQPCPFCPIMGIDETEYRNCERTFAGEQANVKGIPSCEPCMKVIDISDSTAEYIADLAGRLDLPLMDDVDQLAKAIQEKLAMAQAS